MKQEALRDLGVARTLSLLPYHDLLIASCYLRLQGFRCFSERVLRDLPERSDALVADRVLAAGLCLLERASDALAEGPEILKLGIGRVLLII